ncbi:hypothetical protein BG011_003393 [Mortierella polycephala]|uniref:P-type phospholipid transporter n=1 Tax=Mortierella polycephala TaxID=41804 RepID=A0A9P6U2Z6_9FUNG|nr:hypothetical protein BG011_003393 [Mortierella polycephala]
MVNALKKIYNKTPWQQKRLSQPLSDPNYNPATLQHSTVYEEDDHQDSEDQDEQRQQNHRLQRQVSIVEPAFISSRSSNNTVHNNNNPSNNNSMQSQQPLRRVMTRADTKISLRKSKKDSRRVFVNIPPPAQYLDKNGTPKLAFGSNRINTAKYTTLTFLPKNLFEQFRRVANMFFLFMAIIQLTPTFTVGSPFLTVFPLCFVVGVTAIKDGFEDYKRHVEDRNFNQRLCQQLKNVVNYNYATDDQRAAIKEMSVVSRAWNSLVHGFSTGTKKSMRALKLAKKPSRELPELDINDLAPVEDDPVELSQEQSKASAEQPVYVKEQWHNLRVGDFIMLKNNQAVPADAIILSTSETEGSCFIETKDLDGETNLKTRVSLHETSKYNTARRCSRLKCYIDMEPINANLFTFNGSLTMLARRRHADSSEGHSGHAGNRRYSHYAPSVTSSMMSSQRGSMDETRDVLEDQQDHEHYDTQRPALNGTSASDYAELHRNKSQKRRSRFFEPLDTDGDKQEYDEYKEMASPDDGYPKGTHALHAMASRRSSLHMSRASGLAKDVLRANHEQQLQRHESQRERVAGPSQGTATSNSHQLYKETTIPMDINNMLLRGHVIRNTHWVIAVIVATGTDTKIMLNSGETPSKRSRIEKTMNIQVALNFAILLLLCIVCAVGSTIYDRKWRGTGAEELWNMSTRGVVIEGVVTFFTSLIIFQNIIPISLYISIEFVKTFQAYFIWQDSDMYDVELDQYCTPKTWNLTDDLGQIEYVFSDKTGTLTRNIMEFKKCSINGKVYGNNAVSGQTDAEKGIAMMSQNQDPGQDASGETGTGRRQSQPSTKPDGESAKEAVLKEYDHVVRQMFEPTYMDPLEILTFADPDILRDMSGQQQSGANGENTSDNGEGSSNSTQLLTRRTGGSRQQTLAHDGSPASNIHDFFTLLALCHTVVVEQPEEVVEDDEDDDFGMYEDSGSPTNGDDSSGKFADSVQERKGGLHLGLREKLRQRVGAVGLAVPGANSAGGSGSGTRSRKNSNTGPAPASNQQNGVSVDDQGKPKPTVCYRAESPDEAALVSAAKNVGFVFVSRGAVGGQEGDKKGSGAGNSRQNVNLSIMGQDHTYEQLDVIKFNSTRKRMTVIVREPEELGGRILLLTKGADNVIFERLSQETKEEALRDQTEQDIEAFSNMGLRTLTLAQRVLDQETYDAWTAKYAEAGKALDDRAKKMDQVAEEIEKDLTLLGATAIEDKLQEGVPDSIAALREGGIKVWVLTGDKLETAINIGFASRLLEKDMKLEIMKMGRNEKPEQILKRFKVLVDNVLSGKHSVEELDASELIAGSNNHDREQDTGPLPSPSTQPSFGNTWDEKHLPMTPSSTSLLHDPVVSDRHPQHQQEHALIVDGSALKILLDDPDARKDLIKLSDVCFSVICCRASPLQKALVVELIRRGKKTVCLAIGDGANDVSMIQAANIGVGIAGQEGMQAAMASDYSITQFRFIRKLVLVHGHWGYMRIAEMILNFFFKNVLWVAAVLWFQIYCGFSAMLFYDYTFVSLYNLMFTAVPVLVLGATDQDLIAPYILRYPSVYKLGIHQKRYNQYRFVVYMLDGVWQSLIVFWFWRGVYGMNILSHSGIDSSLLEFSTSVAITNVVIASLYVGLHTYHWTWLMHFAVWGSIIFLILLVLIYGAFVSSPIYHVALKLFGQGPFWFMLILSVSCAFLLRYTVLFVSFWWFPDDVHAVRGIMVAEKRNARAQNVKWTGLGPDGMTPQEQSEQEKALLKKEDLKREAKEAAKAEKQAAKGQKNGKGGERDDAEEQPYDLTMVQINVNDHGHSREPSPQNQIQTQAQPPYQMQHGSQRNLPKTPLEIQQQLLMAQQQQQQQQQGQGETLKPNDPSFKHSRRISSYNYDNIHQDKPAALPPVPSPSLPSLPPTSSSSSVHAHVPDQGQSYEQNQECDEGRNLSIERET